MRSYGNVFGAKLPFANPLAKNSEHFGFNVAVGGKGSKYESDPTKEISSDGRSGHVYLNVKGNLMGVGLEGTAPNTEGPLGEHSKTGGADQFSAGENEKFAIKFKSAMFKTYIENYLSATGKKMQY